MAIDEKTRLDMRQWFTEAMGERLAEAVMASMPPLDYEQFATKQDLTNLSIELRGEIQEVRGELGRVESSLRGEIQELRGEMGRMESSLGTEIQEVRAGQVGLSGEVKGLGSDLRQEMSALAMTLTRWMLATQLTTLAAMAGLIVLLT